MKVEIHHRCSDYDSYRAARIKSMFNCVTGCNFDLVAEIPTEGDWAIGLVVGPSGSGKSSIGRALFGSRAVYRPTRWPKDEPIVDAIGPGRPFEDVTASLAAVGLGSVPAWLRPYRVLSTGERFRADLARVICRAPKRVVIDEFTSVVDRQVARVGSAAFAKAWRKTGGRAVLLSCHRDIVDWLQPDWLFDTATGKYSGRSLRPRPDIEVQIHKTDWRYWPLFEPHHYLKLPRMIAATNYIGLVDGNPIAHVALSPRPGLTEVRAARFVVMPEWQGIGVGLSFLTAIARRWRQGRNRYRRRMTTLINTAHPGLCRALRRRDDWLQVSAHLYGADKTRAARSLQASAQRAGGWSGTRTSVTGYGGHFRSIQGFRFGGRFRRPVKRK